MIDILKPLLIESAEQKVLSQDTLNAQQYAALFNSLHLRRKYNS